MKKGRVFVDKEHQLSWMLAGGARELNALLPEKARVLGGQIAGREAASSGRLLDAAKKGGARSREIADDFRRRSIPDA